MKHKFFTSLLAATLTISALPATAIYANETNEIAINTTNFPDQVFRDCVLNEVDIDKNGALSAQEITIPNSFDHSWPDEEDGKITSLKGIEYFPEITYLNVSGNELETLDLSKNTKLQFLNVSSNKLTSVNIDGCKNLTSIDVNSNQLETLDVTSATELEDLICTENKLTSLNISKNQKLRVLYAEKNALTSLDLSNNQNLQVLLASENNLTELDITPATSLQVVDVHHNAITTLDTSKNPNLDNVRYLATRTNLKTLDPVPFSKIGGLMEYIEYYEDTEYFDQIFKTTDLILDLENKTIQLAEGKTKGILRINMGDDLFEDFEFYYEPEQKPVVKPDTKPEVKPDTKPEVKPEAKPENKPAQKVEKEETPKTGDTTNYMFLVSSFVVAGAAVLKLRKKVMD